MKGLASWLIAGILAVLAVGTLSESAATAASDPKGVNATVVVNGRNPDSITDNDPLRLSPTQGADIKLKVTNPTNRSVTVTSVRLEGRVMGLSFFSYNTEVDLVLAPGASGNRAFHINLTDLKNQATGLLPARLALLDPGRKVITDNGFPVDVRGKITSVYGEFGLAVAAVTVLWLLSLILRLVTRRLPENRWRRALQFCAAGFGLGLSLTFTLSALRVLTPDASTWAPFVAGCGAGGLLLGYLTPGPRFDEDEEQEFLPVPGLLPARVNALAGPQFGELPGAQQRELDGQWRPQVQQAALGPIDQRIDLDAPLIPGLGSTTVRPHLEDQPSSPPPQEPPPLSEEERRTVISLPNDDRSHGDASTTVQLPGSDAPQTVISNKDTEPGRS